ncbi:MAG: NUDIX domain-containing protein [Chthoniobacterales bacterium]|nr:NUDIX domain-containing protein [Chthoniobacterales bacterium]
MFRRGSEDREIEILLVHPGGPFFTNKDAGSWTMPKGEAAPGEDLLARARIEFEEEIGIAPDAAAHWIAVGSVKQKGGKTVHAWAFEGDLPKDFQLRSNLFRLEWPPLSGRITMFPEVDRAAFFPIEEALDKINPAQRSLVARLLAIVTTANPAA